MKELIEHTGGLFIFTCASLICKIIFISILCFYLITKFKEGFNDSKKMVRFVIILITIVIFALLIGITIGYYYGIYKSIM